MNEPLPRGWTRTALGDVCRVEYGKGLPKRQRVETGSVGVYGSAGLVGRHDNALVDKPAVIVGRKGNAGAVWHSKEPSWPIDTTYFLRVPSGTCAEYLGMQLGTLNLVNRDSSTTIPSLRRPDLEAVSIALAPTAEQGRIVAAIEEHLSRLAVANDAITAAQARIEASRRAVLATAFAGRLVPQDPNDEPASTLLERISADRQPSRRPPQPIADTIDPSDLTSDLPLGWTWSTLGQVCSRPQYGWTTKSDRNAGLLYLRTTDISRGDVNWNKVPFCVDEPSRLEDFLLRDGDIVVCRAGTVGASLLLKNPPRSVFASYLIRLRVHREFVPAYVALFLQSPRFWAAIAHATIGIAIPNVNAKKLTAIRIPLAPFAEQERIVGVIEEHFSRLDAASGTISAIKAKIEASRRSVLAEAFAGRLVPQDANDEPASVLLERIAEARRA